ncbi:hypothetical protein EV05_0987 [Prochlorococcus sp. MIT 0601]|nr:hypothetical protein EV05_0987 [Prochlorococcus sp. MIT 0601]
MFLKKQSINPKIAHPSCLLWDHGLLIRLDTRIILKPEIKGWG